MNNQSIMRLLVPHDTAGLSSTQVLLKPGVNNLIFEKCSICLNNIIVNDLNTLCQNKHIFHTECINLWLLRKNTCPLCRKSIVINSEIENNIDENIDIIFENKYIRNLYYFYLIIGLLLIIANCIINY